MKKIFLSLILMLIFASKLGYAEDTHGIWSQFEVEKKVTPKVSIGAGEELRFKDGMGLFYSETRIGASYKAFSHLKAGLEYLHVEQKGKTDWTAENRPRIYLTPDYTIKGFLFEDRNSFELRLKEFSENTFRYRNRLTITAPYKWTKFEIQPYTSEELFIESNRNGLEESQLFAGFKYHIFGPLYGSAYYGLQGTKNSKADWQQNQILGSGLKVSF